MLRYGFIRIVLWLLVPSVARAASPPLIAQLRALRTIGSIEDDRLRVAQLLGRASTDGYLLRTASTLSAFHDDSGDGVRAWLLWPHVRATSNSAIPFSLNQGTLWAGRGVNVLVRAGGIARFGSTLTIVIAPEFGYSENRQFEVLPGREPGRSPFSSPWHIGAESADLPLRFGTRPLRVLTPGQSSLTVSHGPLAVGASTEDQWWGPGIWDALVLSNNAQGIPHAFLRTARPIRAGPVEIEARLISGVLTESLFFDTIATNNYRSISGIVAVVRPAAEPNLSLGVTRTVVARLARPSELAQHAADFVRYWQTVSADPRADSSRTADQLMSAFARWVFPQSGVEVYGEWSRVDPPRSLRELLVAPQHTRGRTIGLQWARPAAANTAVRLAAELTSVEQKVVFTDRPPSDYYTGRGVPQGYTQRGRVLGAAIGPGASTQWLAGDFLARRWQAGLVLGRIRWENDALYRQQSANLYRHDVSILAGLRGGVRGRRGDFSAEIAFSDRLNYLFQNGINDPDQHPPVDIHNLTLSFQASPR